MDEVRHLHHNLHPHPHPHPHPYPYPHPHPRSSRTATPRRRSTTISLDSTRASLATVMIRMTLPIHLHVRPIRACTPDTSARRWPSSPHPHPPLNLLPCPGTYTYDTSAPSCVADDFYDSGNKVSGWLCGAVGRSCCASRQPDPTDLHPSPFH